MENSRLIKELKELRLNKNIKQDELGAYLNIDPSAISLYENGKRPIQVDTLEKWLKFFNMKFILVDENAKERIINPSIEEVETFQRLKDRRNEIMRNRQKEQFKYLKSTFNERKGPFHENRGFIANHLMPLVGMVEEVKLKECSATIIYFDTFVINATFEEFVDYAELYGIPSRGGVEFLPFMEGLCLHTFPLSKKDWNSTGVVLYQDSFPTYQRTTVIRDAKGFTPELLVKIKENSIQYFDLVYSAERAIKENSYDLEELEMLTDKISEIVRKWQINSKEQHPKFGKWSSSDLKATCYAEILKEKVNNKSK
ncbi:helix-turn-helix domain-containing protein [Niallia taxi]|uniref:helix-turn-helix domain-containing protein n=1 Tax=Niallia taxi TaxID=2499688 RepID=UPI003D279815